MKPKLFLLFSFLLSISAHAADGDTLRTLTVEGVSMSFKILSETEKTVQVGASTISSAVFDTDEASLYVPVGSKERYQQADGWNYFYRIIEIGDLDGDGQLTVNDITMLVSIYLDNETAENADMDGDGQITVNDITVLINLYLDANAVFGVEMKSLL